MHFFLDIFWIVAANVSVRQFDVIVLMQFQFGRLLGLVFLESGKNVLVLQDRQAVTEQGGENGIQNRSHKTGGKTVVIQVQSVQRLPGVEYDCGVDKAGNDAEGPTKETGDGGQTGTEQRGQLESHARILSSAEKTWSELARQQQALAHWQARAAQLAQAAHTENTAWAAEARLTGARWWA